MSLVELHHAIVTNDIDKFDDRAPEASTHNQESLIFRTISSFCQKLENMIRMIVPTQLLPTRTHSQKTYYLGADQSEQAIPLLIIAQGYLQVR